MRIDQIAYYCATDEAETKVKSLLGIGNAEWVTDKVTGRSSVWGEPPAINTGALQFCYKLGIELELLRYVQGFHWHQHDLRLLKPSEPFVSHVGIHLDDNEDFPPMPGCRLAQETRTISHTSDYLITGAGAGRKYHYRVFQLAEGNYLKYIKRIYPGSR